MADLQSRPYFTGEAGQVCDTCVFSTKPCPIHAKKAPAECQHAFPHLGWGPTAPCIRCGLTFEQAHEQELHRLADDGCPHA